MSDYTGELKNYLRKAGCSFERQGKGDHEIWYSKCHTKTGWPAQKILNRQHYLLKSQIPSTNFQNKPPSALPLSEILVIEIWCLFVVWDLLFGASVEP